jgi:7-carboxy-7-deazaguanine synthase
MSPTLQIIEIFRSIQGESTLAGLPCVFIRLAGCNLRCRWCDTRYAADGVGQPVSVEEICGRAEKLSTGLVCVTGGEPLLQEHTPILVNHLLEEGQRVQVETNGSRDMSVLPEGARRVMDVKCPDSGAAGTTLQSNFRELADRDELKFVIATRRDFDWACRLVRTRQLTDRCPVLFSPASLSGNEEAEVTPRKLAEWILSVNLPLRLQLQLHRILWPDIERGV